MNNNALVCFNWPI